jgi:Mor family transcriptional regulator
VLPDRVPLEKRSLLFVAYLELDLHPSISIAERDRQIMAAYLGGMKQSALARQHGVSPQRVWQIVTNSHR